MLQQRCFWYLPNNENLSFFFFSSPRDFWKLWRHSSGTMAAAVAWKWHSTLPHPPPGWQSEPSRAGRHRRPGQRSSRGGAALPAHLCHGAFLLLCCTARRPSTTEFCWVKCKIYGMARKKLWEAGVLRSTRQQNSIMAWIILKGARVFQEVIFERQKSQVHDRVQCFCWSVNLTR